MNCPSPRSSSFETCRRCLSEGGISCGWCSLDGDSGGGLCTEGAAHSGGGRCNAAAGASSSLLKKANLIQGSGSDGGGAAQWNFFACPPENECLNGNHECDEEAEDCVDTLNFYECVCKKGFGRSPG